jgi:cystathionine beta-lyase/cystathionine gamma-synthase
MTQENDPTSQHIDTRLVHGGRGKHTGTTAGSPTVPPIYTSTTYLHTDIETQDKAFSGLTPDGEPAFVYARQANPSTYHLEEALTLAEGGVGTVTFGSGMAAIHAALLAAGLAPGAKILASQDLYGPTIGLIRKIFIPTGVELVLADLSGPDVAEVIEREQPDVIYAETVSNPLVKIHDLDAISAAAKAVDAVTVIDSTFSSPYLLRPIEHGFDLVVHSATKYISGHGDSTGGAVISARRTLLDQLRAYYILLGATLSPFEAHLMLRGLRTLALRVERQSQNALQIARFLHEHPAIERVHYPGLPEHPQHELAGRLLDHGLYGGLLAFEIKERTRDAAFRFMNRLQICLPATSLGDVFTLVSYPSISSHRTLSAEECQKMGINAGCIRLSAGIEHADDLIKDLDQALSK